MSEGISSGSSTGHSTQPNSSSDMSYRRAKRFMKNSPIFPFVIVGVIVLVIVIAAWSRLSGGPSGNSAVASSNDKRVEILAPKGVQDINKSFEFPLKDQDGKDVGTMKYEVQNVELRDEIVIKGERAAAVRGKTFLVVNIKVTNSLDKSIKVNVKDYIRLALNNSNEKLAPDIHNDPVDVLAISTKLTRVGFPISDSDNNLTLQIGEINGKKQMIKLNLR
jgi:hypothetical protein